MSAVLIDYLWLKAFQKKQLEKFAARGIPTRKEENWKYTQISFLPERLLPTESPTVLPALFSKNVLEGIKLVFINGSFSKELSQIEILPEGVTLSPISMALHSQEKILKPYLTKEFDVQRYPFAVLNSAQMNDGVFLHVSKNVSLATPIHIVYLNTQNDKNLVCPRNLILADEGADVTLVEEYVSDSENHFTNALTEIYAADNAKVRFHKIQDESVSATHVSAIFAHQHQDSCVNIFTLSKGAQLSREDIFVDLYAKGTECHLAGLYSLSHDNQHADHHLHVDHAAEHGTSSMLYKGILEKKSKAVFNGKVYVHPQAQRTNSYQANHNLLLSKDAEVNTKPELEIYAEDVKCTHGATVGQLDTESLFYLRSRGLDKDSALRMLLTAFADDVLSKISHAAIRHYIQKRVDSYVE